MMPDPSRRGWVGGALVAAVAAGSANAAPPPPPLPPPQALYGRDVRQFGADPTGRADSTAAFIAAAKAGPFVVSDGVYALAGTVAINAYCAMSAAARIDGTATVTFNAGFSAPIAHVFGSGLTVVFNPAFAPEGHPEWWGAISNTPAFDCEPALSACVAACPVTRLQPANYWIARTWKLTTNWRTIQGVGMHGLGANPSTLIATADPGIDIIQMGPDNQPAHIGDFLQGVQLTDLSIARSVAPNLPPEGPDYRTGVSGVRMQYVVQSIIERIWSRESINAFYVKACVATYLDHTHAERTLAAQGGGTGADRYFGYFFDASAKIGLANGNASVYVDFFSSTGAHIPTNAFVYTYGGFTDLFFNRGECGAHANGMLLNGGGAGDRAPSAEDCHIHHVIMDGLSGDGILINQSNSGAAVTISQCYTAGGSGVAVHVVDSLGAISITGCQFNGTSHSTGLLVEGGAGVSSINNIFNNFGAAMVWKNSANCESAGDTIQNFSAAGSDGGAVQLISCMRSVWRGKIKGLARAHHKAVALGIDGLGGGPCDYNLIDCSGIDPECLAGGAANKLTIVGEPVTVVGVTGGAPVGYSNNVVAGVMN
jgi:hypothetical protein